MLKEWRAAASKYTTATKEPQTANRWGGSQENEERKCQILPCLFLHACKMQYWEEQLTKIPKTLHQEAPELAAVHLEVEVDPYPLMTLER